jgi:nitrite reductase/ring-hydroxylating ferredoxin subunit
MEKVCKTTDVAKAAMKGFIVKEKQILMANIDGQFFAVDALCPHMNGYLPSGKFENGEVICPVHHARYDVKTGKLVKNVDMLVKMATGHGAKDLKVYTVKVEGGDVFIDI